MGFGALRSIIRPVSRTLFSSRSTFAFSPATFSATSQSPSPEVRLLFGSLHRHTPWIPASNAFHSLTDTRFPKRRPSLKPRKKRASLRPPGPYAWVKYVPGQPILPNQPNEGSVKNRNERKRRRQRRAFILSEAKKRKSQVQEAKRKKMIKRVERKMAAVARERAWAQRLAELQQLEEEKKKAMA
ncbi:uncharacterized protein LOC132286987 [Cornus florida]|uniref:uncharacterized protein LOC132286987 n=1 Tax=Cornus florida TaxID=4283 RepID=UPI00289D4F35|nr:uncharacterized protein LOC132286987 [Cornus florida]XP_059645423.1 uncharacterized protein LOC132286987 [Cornus florida]XP_059645424.1 uncharacterized protein LOC132286987 [Cornus florida]XP_059645425.1 uncharacterized protein LOC132286987 [Cornus florida]XP_059645426.1 uncharacterized protein LOC132286987 [Cornus florida]